MPKGKGYGKGAIKIGPGMTKKPKIGSGSKTRKPKSQTKGPATRGGK